VLGESNADDRTESRVSRFLRFGDRESSDVIDFAGLVGSEARALMGDGGRLFL
jgi:hypothetical protein